MDNSENKEILDEEIKEIIDKNKDIKKYISNNKKDYNSISYLIDLSLSHSDCIKLGNYIEKILNDIILYSNKNIVNIKEKNIKNTKEKDHLYIDNINKIIYYAELKSNLYLDTEKTKATISKCLNIKNELELKYQDYNVKMFLVGIRYYKKSIIPNNILKKYILLNNNILGINDYFNELNIKYNFINEIKYKEFINYIVSKMFNNF
jgi:hypothetical protein